MNNKYYLVKKSPNIVNLDIAIGTEGYMIVDQNGFVEFFYETGGRTNVVVICRGVKKSEEFLVPEDVYNSPLYQLLREMELEDEE